jgi:hypothetical protein
MQLGTGNGTSLMTIGRMVVIASNLPMIRNVSLAARIQETSEAPKIG